MNMRRFQSVQVMLDGQWKDVPPSSIKINDQVRDPSTGKSVRIVLSTPRAIGIPTEGAVYFRGGRLWVQDQLYARPLDAVHPFGQVDTSERPLADVDPKTEVQFVAIRGITTARLAR